MLLPYGKSFLTNSGVTTVALTDFARLNFQYAMLKDLIGYNIYPSILTSGGIPRNAKIADVGTGTAYAIAPSTTKT